MFYGYILGGVLFLACSQIFGIDKEIKKIYEGNQSLTGKSGDFMEKYHRAQISFCLHTFEIISTIIMITEYYNKGYSSQFPKTNGTYLPSMIMLAIYGIVTAA